MQCIRGTSQGPVSVCLSVTSRSSTKTAKRRITQTPYDSPGISEAKDLCEIRPGSPPTGAPNAGWVGQLKSIATAIRNSKSSPTTSDNGSRQPTNKVQRSTLNMHRQRTTIASQFTYWLSVASLSHSRWRTISTVKQ